VLDVAILGAGFSGLAGARALSQAGLGRLAVFEARDRVGGRVFNGYVAKGFPVELGGTWVGPGHWAVITSPRDALDTVHAYADLGFDRLLFHPAVVSLDQVDSLADAVL
jgi:monoamine oxidase